MICREFQTIFVHVPKTAGQSVERVLLNEAGADWENRARFLLRPNPDPALGPERLAHLLAREYFQLGYVSRHEFDSMFRFAFVRDPWSRLVSEYLYRELDLECSFRDFVLRDPPTDDFSDFARHLRPQVDYVQDESGTRIVDFIGRFEHLARDFRTVSERVGLKSAVLPTVNRSRKTGVRLPSVIRRLRSKQARFQRYADYYDDELRTVVETRYAADIEAFGYRWEDVIRG